VGEETVYTKHQNLPQPSKHYKQSSLHSSVLVIVGVPFGVLSFRGFILVGRECVRVGGERRLLLSWAKAGKDSKESRKASRSEGDDLEESAACAMAFHRPSFFPSVERAPHHTTTENPFYY